MNRTVSAAIPDGRLSRRSAVGRLTGAGAAMAVAAAGLGMSRDAAQAASVACPIVRRHHPGRITMTDATPTAEAAPLTVVLVHGAFADGSNWSGVIPILQAAGVAVLAPPNPLRGIDHDAAYIASVASQLPGPVLLVAHSYGGAVITNAGSRADNVRGLVYVGAFIPDEGETLQNLADQATDSQVLPALRPPSIRVVRMNPGLSSPSTRRRFTRSSAPTCRRRRRRSWRSRSGPSPGSRSASRRRIRPGRRFPRGRSSPPATSSSARPASASWPNAPGPPSPRSRPRTP